MKRFLLVLTIIFLSGCAHVVSEELRVRADRDLPPMALFSDPDAHRGRIVILG